MATKIMKKSRLRKNLDTIKVQTKNFNKEVISVSEDLVSASIQTGEKYQELLAKAIKGGTVLFAQQQDILFNTLASIKGQYAVGAGRFQKLFGFKPFFSGKKVITAKKLSNPKSTTRAKKDNSIVTVEKDNLKKIKGIGPKTEAILNIANIYTFQDLATTKVQTLKNILDAAGAIYKAVYPSLWIKEAKAFAKKKNK